MPYVFVVFINFRETFPSVLAQRAAHLCRAEPARRVVRRESLHEAQVLVPGGRVAGRDKPYG